MRVDGVRWTGVFILAALWVAPPLVHGQPVPDTLSFDRARALLEAHKPHLRSAQAQGEATGQAARAGALFPNPTVSVSEERTNLEGGGGTISGTCRSRSPRDPGLN